MSLVELLLALTLLVVISVSLLAGFTIARDAFRTDRRIGNADDLDDTLRATSHLVEIAYPVVSLKDPKHPVVMFEGRSDGISFIGLGDGRTLRGGVHAVAIGLEDGNLFADVTPTRETEASPDPHRTRRVVLQRAVGRLRFRYFGRPQDGDRPAWRDNWSQAARQPDLVGIEIAGTDASRGPVRLIVSLPQT